MPVPPEARVTLAGFMEAVRKGDADVERPTVPAKPFRLVRVMVEVFGRPATIVTADGTEIAKSVTLTVTFVE